MPGDEKGVDVEQEHPLLWAIAEFREAVNRLVEEQKGLVLGLQAEPRTVEGALPIPTPASVPLAVSLPPIPQVAAAAPHASEMETWGKKPAPVTPRPRPKDAPTPAPDVSPQADAIEPLAANGGRGSDPTPSGGKPEDPRQRLDALAKLLDKRLKQTAEPLTRTGEP